MPYGWEGTRNRRSGVSLAMRHRLQWFIHLLVLYRQGWKVTGPLPEV